MDGLIFDFYSTDARLKEKNRRLLMELKSDVDLKGRVVIAAVSWTLWKGKRGSREKEFFCFLHSRE